MKIVIGLLGAAAALQVNKRVPSDKLPKKRPIYPPQLHWNEDYHSVPIPLEGKPYLTSTQARFISENSTANQESREPKGRMWWHYNYGAYNVADKEYNEDEHRWSPRRGYQSNLLQLDAELETGVEAMTLTSSKTGATWRVIPDFGEKDPNVMYREEDIGNGKKFSGWTNPLSWTDDGSDDNLVV